MTDLLTPTVCGWCSLPGATTLLYTVPTCGICAVATKRERVNRWLRAVHKENQDESSIAI